MSQQRDSLLQEFQEKKKLHAELISKLRSCIQEKEKVFQQLRTSQQKARELLNQAEKLKKERDLFGEEIKKQKEERGKFHQQVQEKFSLFQSIKDKGKEILETIRQTSVHPKRLEQEIAHLESKLETEVMPFEHEEKLRKKLREMRKQHKEIVQLTVAEKEKNTAAADLAGKRREAQQIHELIQQKAQEAQQKHELLMKVYDELKQIRKTTRPLEDQHQQYRLQIADIKKKLDELSPRLRQLSRFLGEEQKERKEEQKKRLQSLAQRKGAEVEEKLKQKKN